MAMRGIRGATTVEHNTREDIWQAAREMIQVVLQRNALHTENIGAAIFSMTDDRTAAFPTAGGRQLHGFDAVPLFDARQCAIEGALPRCLRVLLLVETNRGQKEIHHVYLHGAARLRPDITQE